MRLICVFLALLSLAAEEGAEASDVVSPASWIADDAQAWALLNDGARSRERWANSPYATLITKVWAQELGTKLIGRLKQKKVDIGELRAWIETTQKLAFGFALIDDEPMATFAGDTGFHVLRTILVSDQAVEVHLEQGKAWLDGDREILPVESGWLWRLTPHALSLAVKPRGTALAPSAPDSDIECTLEPGVMAALDQLLDESMGLDDGEGQFITVSISEIGLHEHQIQRSGVASAARIRAAVLDPIPPEHILDLPGDTLWAAAVRIDPTMLQNFFTDEAAQNDLALHEIDMGLRALGLPKLLDCIPHLGNECLMWCRSGIPWPIFDMDVACDQILADQILAACRTHLHLKDAGDHTIGGVVGIIPLHLAWKNERLRVSTDPLGMDSEKSGRFGDHATVQEAVAHWHKDAFLIAASRSRESWHAIGGLAQLGLLSAGQKSFGTLAADLAKAGRYGYCSARRDDGNLIIDAGGLFGGPIGWIAIGIAAASAINAF